MSSLKSYAVFLLIILVAALFYWINKIDSPIQRVFGILIVSAISYWLGRLHEKICLKGNRTDGRDSFENPPSLYSD